MAVALDKCTARVRDAHIDDVKATTIKEKQKENKNTCILYMKMFTSQI